MKFLLQFQYHKVPEWDDKYIDYEQLNNEIKNVCEELIVMQLQALPLDPDKANQMISRLDKTRNLRHSNYELQKMKLNTSLLEIPERMEEEEGSGYIEYTSHEFDQPNEVVESKPILGE